MLIKDKISQHRDKAKMLKDKYDNLVDKIANAFYEREVWRDENSKLKPKSEKDIMNAAYCLALMIAPRTRFSMDVPYTIHQAEEWKTTPTVYYDYFYIWDEQFKDRMTGSTPCVYLVRKKNLKLLKKECKEAWKYAVGDSSTTLGFKDWLEQATPDDILPFMFRVYENRIDVVTDRKLYLKDIVIIYPNKPFKNFHF
jgi:hypothetical protein